MKIRYTFFTILFLLMATVACERTDFDEIMRKQQEQQGNHDDWFLTHR